MILLTSPKNVYATKRLISEAKKSKIPLEVLGMEELAVKNFKIDIKKYQALYIRSPFVNGSPKYFPDIIKLAKKFKNAGKKVVDSAIADGELGEGKGKDYQKLMKAGLPVPLVFPSPGVGRVPKAGEVESRQLHYPLIAKWTYGFRARHVFFIQDENQLKKIAVKYPKGELLAQEFIDADYEYKIITVGYEALPVILRFVIDKKTHRPDFQTAERFILDIHPGIFQGNEKYPGSSVKPSSGSRLSDALGRDGSGKLISLAERASRLLKRELSKVDILQKGNQFYILEVNRWPGLGSFEKLTKYNVARKFIEYLTE